MKLKNNLHTQTGWDIYETSFNPDQLVTTGSNFMIGNGYLGYRGTPSEWGADKYVACIVSDTYDAAQDNWRELCNVPNGLSTKLFIDNQMLSLDDQNTEHYRRSLNLKYGIFEREQTWKSKTGKKVHIKVEKFASLSNVHLIAMKYEIRVEEPITIKLITGIDGIVWDLKGKHLHNSVSEVLRDILLNTTYTKEQNIQINVGESINWIGIDDLKENIFQTSESIYREFILELNPNKSITLEKYVIIYHSNDLSNPKEQTINDLEQERIIGYQSLKNEHQAVWDKLWEDSYIEIIGNLEDQTLVNFNLYHNFIATPMHAELPIGARGLSTQVYQGAAFWDQEIFNLPMYIYTQPQIAKKILKYRFNTLPGAQKKAQELGYKGAFYAWTSGKTGEELFPDYFFKDLISGRKVRNHFNDWQIHISSDIAYAVWQYYQATHDWDFVLNYGAEIIFEVAKFLGSHVYFKKDKDRYEFIRLLGPDEYHENVDNNVFTNYLAHFTFQKALVIYVKMQVNYTMQLNNLFAKLSINQKDIEYWREIQEKLYLPKPDEKSKLIEQFDGYFKLEDIIPLELSKRLINPDEYWGWPNGIAVETQVLKQADVLQTFAVLKNFPKEVIQSNYDYYEPRTEHGSSLSPSVHAQVACQAGYPDKAYQYFQEAVSIDMYNASKKYLSGGSFLGGIHTAACGATWLMIIQGFAGFYIDNDDNLIFNPCLPISWESISFCLQVRKNKLEITINQEKLIIISNKENKSYLKIIINKEHLHIKPGEKIRTFYQKK